MIDITTINTFKDICELGNVNIKKFRISRNASKEQKADNAYEKLKLIVKVLNEGWLPDWSKNTQVKHYPYFKKVDDKYVCYGYGSYALYPVVGSRLVYKSQELAEFVVDKFMDIYNEYLDYA